MKKLPYNEPLKFSILIIRGKLDEKNLKYLRNKYGTYTAPTTANKGWQTLSGLILSLYGKDKDNWKKYWKKLLCC